MKRSMLALATILFATTMLFSQDNGILFNAKYLPEKKYITTSNATIEGEISIKVDKKTREMLESVGITLPMKVRNVTNSEITITTGNEDENGFPVHFRYDKNHSEVSAAGNTSENDNPLTGALIAGRIDKDNLIRIESITGVYLDDTQRDLIISTIETLQGSIKFPEKPLKIGDKFTQEIPFSFPIEGLERADLKMICNYKLVDVKDNIAIFDVRQKVTFNIKGGDQNIRLRGHGKGQSMYNISHNFFSFTQESLAINMSFVTDGKKSKANMISSSSYNISISDYTAFNEEVIEEYDDVEIASLDDYYSDDDAVVEVVEEGDEAYEDYVVEAADSNDEIYVVMDETDYSATEAADVEEVAEVAEAVEAVEVVEAEYPGGEPAYFEVPQEIVLQGHNWILSELNGKTVINPSPEHSEIYISFSSTDSNFNGSGGCNSYFGTYTISREGWITLTDIGMTKMACPDMSVEEELIRTLKGVNAYSIEGDKLTLKKGGKYPVAVFTYELPHIDVVEAD